MMRYISFDVNMGFWHLFTISMHRSGDESRRRIGNAGTWAQSANPQEQRGVSPREEAGCGSFSCRVASEKKAAEIYGGLCGSGLAIRGRTRPRRPVIE